MNIRYQTVTLGPQKERGDYLYEGPSLEAATMAAREYAGRPGSGTTRAARCRIVFVTGSGEYRPVMDYADGLAVRGYVYEGEGET